jgi:hypothetical protein
MRNPNLFPTFRSSENPAEVTLIEFALPVEGVVSDWFVP